MHQRPYAIATAGTPLSILFDYPTSTYTYRYISPVRPSSSSDDTPSAKEVTELFLPARHYTEGKFYHSISTGGRIRYDYPNQRAYVWFVDTDIRGSQTAPKVRRIDFYVPERARDTGKVSSTQAWGIVLFAILFLGIAWWTQMNEIWWDKKLGYTHSKWGTW
jgi:hypothetical protein